MANIRKQAIFSSILVYIGFIIGAVNTYFFTKTGSFTPEQYGLTRIFYDLGQNIFIFSSVGLVPVLYKFYPYYKDNLEDKKNDLLTWILLVSFVGFILVLAGGYFMEPFVVRKFIQRSPLILEYYYLIFLFGFGMLFFSMLEAFCWCLHKTVTSNFLKETGMRILVLALVLFYLNKWINFEAFIRLFALVYLVLFLIILIYIIKLNKFHLTFHPSYVTKRFKKKMVAMWSLTSGGVMIHVVSQTIDTIIIASLNGLSSTGIFTLAQFAANLVQVPQRSIQSISTGVLSQAWKDKNYVEINRIYERSCINLLLLALFIFANIWLNIYDAFSVFHIQEEYKAGIAVIFVLGIARIIDAGTGVNNIIIGTSTFWRFDFVSGIILLALRIPLTYMLIKKFGILGSAYAEVISYSLYNFIRFEYLRRKFNMQPFNFRTALTLLMAVTAFGISWFLFRNNHGLPAIFGRSITFSLVFVASVFYLELTPDAMQLYYKVVEKWKK